MKLPHSNMQVSDVKGDMLEQAEVQLLDQQNIIVALHNHILGLTKFITMLSLSLGLGYILLSILVFVFGILNISYVLHITSIGMGAGAATMTWLYWSRQKRKYRKAWSAEETVTI